MAGQDLPTPDLVVGHFCLSVNIVFRIHCSASARSRTWSYDMDRLTHQIWYPCHVRTLRGIGKGRASTFVAYATAASRSAPNGIHFSCDWTDQPILIDCATLIRSHIQALAKARGQNY